MLPCMATPLGFEPRITPPKGAVLPLHHGVLAHQICDWRSQGDRSRSTPRLQLVCKSPSAICKLHFNRCRLGYSAGFGKRISTVVPLPFTLDKEIFPPCASTTDFAMARPRPVLFVFPWVTNGSNNFGNNSEGIPTPVSEIRIA